MNSLKKNIGKENPKKRADPSVQGIVKNQLETMEVGKAPLFPHKFSLYFSLTV